jgi:hypothetical protein
VEAASILKHTIVANEGSSQLTRLSSSPLLSFFDMLLQLLGALEHNLFICPFVADFGFLHF